MYASNPGTVSIDDRREGRRDMRRDSLPDVLSLVLLSDSLPEASDIGSLAAIAALSEVRTDAFLDFLGPKGLLLGGPSAFPAWNVSNFASSFSSSRVA
jgi:hypothetical protein